MIRNELDNGHYTVSHTFGNRRERDNIPGGRVLLTRVRNDDCSDHRAASTCSSRALWVHASDTRLFGLRTSR
jgi:hypothetical protein